MKVCSEPGCPEISDGPKCPEHRRAFEAARGSRIERGYDSKHFALRRRWKRAVAKGEVNCARCGNRISPLEPFDLDHTDDRTGYLGPSHVRCNRSAPWRKAEE